jgi:uncharacterized protein YkwD
MFSPARALTAFAIIFVGAAIPTTQLVQHAFKPAAAHTTTAGTRSVATFSGLRSDAGCRKTCEPPDPPSPSPVPEATDAAPAAAAPVAAAPPVQAPAPRPAPPAVVVGSTQQAYINGDRRASGLAPLNWSSCLAGIAASWASYMARTGVFQHGPGVNQDFGCGLGSGQTGENIAWMTGGPNDAQANTMFMNSPEHRANILGPYRYVGTAWASANGKSYIVEEFG